jgi:Nucleotidyltransferase of unknown function (DUF6036)
VADLWGLVWGKPEVDPNALAEAIEREAQREGLDFRTRLLIRDSSNALVARWGRERFAAWLKGRPGGARIEQIATEDLGEPGFPSLQERLMERTEPDTVRQFLRDLGTRLERPVRLCIGGSIALILPGHLSRATEDIDVVDEVPPELRAERALLERLRRTYGLQLTHFQSHYLPSGWAARVQSLEPFGQLQAFLVDVIDVFLSKLFSNRDKDLDDLRALWPALDREAVEQHLREHCCSLLGEEALRRSAERNWYVLTGQALPNKGA